MTEERLKEIEEMAFFVSTPVCDIIKECHEEIRRECECITTLIQVLQTYGCHDFDKYLK